MNERLEIHDVFNPVMLIPFLCEPNRTDIDDLLYTTRPPGHDSDTVGKIDGFLDGMGHE
jgi:hypothetical protein